MNVLRKKLKVRPIWGIPDGRDRLSNLPDEILAQILSFLPTKYAVATSVLSSRWKDLYKLTSTLDFDDSVSFKPQKRCGFVRRNARFRKFVDAHLARFKHSTVRKFRLICGTPNSFDSALIGRWIEVACSHNISELELSVRTRVPHRLPLQLYPLACKNLSVLKLDIDFEVEIPDSVEFPCLKVLVLKEIKLSVDTSLNGFLYRCPLLEELVISGCDMDEGDVCITNPLLRRLTLDDELAGRFDELTGNVTCFDAPNLVYFKYCKWLADQYEVRNLNSVVEAHITIFFNDDDFDEPEDLCDTLLELISGLSKCEILYLSGQCLEALTSGDSQLPIFQNLSRLELGMGCDISWNDVLLDILNSTPLLESLSFEQGLINFNDIEGGPAEKCLLHGRPVPSCVRSRLKVIEVKRFLGEEEEMGIINYFLQNAKVLEKLRLHWYWCVRKYLTGIHEKEKKILQLPKASDACSIAFL